MYLAQWVGACRLTDIAEVFGLKYYGGASNAIAMLERAMEADRGFRQEVNTIINRLDP